MNSLVAIPAYNEGDSVAQVVRRAFRYRADVLVVDDGSTDGTSDLLQRVERVTVIRHPRNEGYGTALRTAFRFAVRHGYDVLLTMDADGQHEVSSIPDFLAAAEDCDIVSGSRYLREFEVNTPAPIERRRINRLVTDQLNACFGLGITDAFCGFKAYRTTALAELRLVEPGYGMPLELWVQAAYLGLRIRELPVPRIYLESGRSFGDRLDDVDARLLYYQQVIDRAIERVQRKRGGGAVWPVPRIPLLQRADQ